MVLTLQKLVHLHPGLNESDSESDDNDSLIGSKNHKRGRISKVLQKMFSKSKAKSQSKYNEAQGNSSITGSDGYVEGHTDGVPGFPMQKLRTLQRYHGGENVERAAYMEDHSPLTKARKAVSAEQVSIFLTSGRESSSSNILMANH